PPVRLRPWHEPQSWRTRLASFLESGSSPARAPPAASVTTITAAKALGAFGRGIRDALMVVFLPFSRECRYAPHTKEYRADKPASLYRRRKLSQRSATTPLA